MRFVFVPLAGLDDSDVIAFFIIAIAVIISLKYLNYILKQENGKIEDKNFFKYLIRRFKEIFKFDR